MTPNPRSKQQLIWRAGLAVAVIALLLLGLKRATAPRPLHTEAELAAAHQRHAESSPTEGTSPGNESAPTDTRRQPAQEAASPVTVRSGTNTDSTVARTLRPDSPATAEADTAESREAAAAQQARAHAEEEKRYAALQEQAHEELSTAFEQLRPAAIARCWPQGAPRGGPQVGMTYQFIIGPDGNEVARGMTESQDNVSAATKACLREMMSESMRIRPPGRNVNVDVFVSYP